MNMHRSSGYFGIIALGMLLTSCNSESNGLQHSDNSSELSAVPFEETTTDDILIEGDMLISRASLQSNTGALAKSGAMGALIASSTTPWPAGSVIDYYFDLSSGTTIMSDGQKNELRRALKDLSYGVNIAFREISSATPYAVQVRAYSGVVPLCPEAAACSRLGMRTNGIAYFSNQNNGLIYDTFMHEFSHVLGFSHEMQRKDRNAVVTIVDPTDPQYAEVDGDYLGTNFDLSSIMMYPGIQPKDEPNNANWRWIGQLYLQSYSDFAARQTKFGANTGIQNTSYLRHTASQKYMCRTSTNSLVLQSAKAEKCKWVIGQGYLNLGRSALSGAIEMSRGSATTIRATERTSQGFGIYLTYTTSTNVLSLQSQGGGDTYATKWIPIPSTNSETGVFLWNGLASCLGLDATYTKVGTHPLNESNLPAQLTGAHAAWEIIPVWNPTVAY